MKPVFHLFWQLCRLQKGPQDVPYSPILLLLLVLALLSLSGLIVLLLDPDYLQYKMLGSGVAILSWGALLFVILRFKRAESRFVQTMTACMGTDLIISALGVPLQFGVMGLSQESLAGNLFRFALLGLIIWDILIKGRIYSAAMEVGRIQGNLLSLLIWLSVLSISYRFLPEAAQSAQ